MFFELAEHTETKMIVFTSLPLQGYAFFVNFGYSRQGETKEAEMIDVHQNLAFVETFLC